MEDDQEQQLDTLGIDMGTLISEWHTARDYTAKFTRDFRQLDSLADAIPVNHQDGNPYVGDTTIAGLVRQIPRDSLQQIPVFAAVVNGTKNSIPAQICSWILRKNVFNEDTFGKGLISTMQMAAEEALKHGYAPVINANGQMYDEFGTRMRLQHYSLVAAEPGVQDANESGYFYVAAELTKSRVRKILRAAENNEATTWNIPALKKLLEVEPETQNYSIYGTEARNTAQGTSSPTYLFVTRKETGKGGEDVVFCEQLEEAPLRITKNPSKFGFPRVQYLVIDPAPLTMFGISRVRLASPNQNLMNAYYQNIARMFIINSDPPLLKRGRFTKPVQLKRRQVWEALDQNSTVELKEMGTDILTNFVQIQSAMAGQIQNIMGRPSGTLNGGANSQGYSKTNNGVKMQERDQNSVTTQITNILENFLRQHGLVGLDSFLAEQSGTDVLIVDDEAKNAINRIKPDLIGEDNALDVTWEEFYGMIKTLSVTIELSIGKEEMDQGKREDIQDMLTVMSQTADPADPVKQAKIADLENRLLEKTVPEAVSSASQQPIAPSQPALPM